MRSISIFGSTGSIGQNTVDLILHQGGPAAYRVVALTGNGNIPLLARQARALRAELAVTADPAQYEALKAALAGTDIAVAAGPEALVEAAARPAEWVMSAIVGVAGLAPGLEAARHCDTLALANNESLVCAGPLLIDTCAAHETRLLPVDSEHSAIFQALQGEDRGGIERLLLTASGGPFRQMTRAQMAGMTLAQAVAHPNWSMGQRISIDSATMFNKALEMIEAQVLFGVAPEAIEVVVHPQSIIHSMVGFADGSIVAQLGPPDMRGAIGYALNYPKRRPLPVDRLDFAALAQLSFEAEDPTRFPALAMAREVMATGGLAGAIFNGAKEAALDAFIAGRIGFLEMAEMVRAVLDELGGAVDINVNQISLADVMRYDTLARARAADWAAARV